MTKRKIVGLLTNDTGLGDDYQGAMRVGIEQACRERDLDLLVFAGRSNWSKPAGHRELYGLLDASWVDGIVIAAGVIAASSPLERVLAGLVERCPVPTCAVGQICRGIRSIVVDNKRGVARMVDHLVEVHGRRSFVYIGGPPGHEEAEQRLEGARAALARHGMELSSETIVHGNFSRGSGGDAIRQFLERGLRIDGVIAANDDMATGALDALQVAGLSCPRDVAVAGFDDSPSARLHRPPLSTVRQPIVGLGTTAVSVLAEMWAGAEPPMAMTLDTELVLRESCGCHPSDLLRSRQTTGIDGDVAAAQTAELIQLLTPVVDGQQRREEWARKLLKALQSERAGVSGDLARAFDELIDELPRTHLPIHELQRVMTSLLAGSRGQSHLVSMENAFHAVQSAIGVHAYRRSAERQLHAEYLLEEIRISWERLGTTLTSLDLKQAFAAELPRLGVKNALIALNAPDSTEHLRPWLCLEGGAHLDLPEESYPAELLIPPGVFSVHDRWSLTVVPLSFESIQLGVAVLNLPVHVEIYSLLQEQIGSAIRAVRLHEEIVEKERVHAQELLRQAALRERLERDHLEKEAKIAAQIQTAILPRSTIVEGLEISARMLPAISVGGDYYDVIPVDGGCWLGIGDVTGHGLLAGLIMLMIQGMVGAMVRKESRSLPSEVVVALNSALHENIRVRLGRNDHATLTLLKYERDGTVSFSGAHEDLVVYRDATGRCELIRPPGFWVGAVADVADLTTDATFQLHDGDLLVLYSDGVTEAMDGQNEQFGLTRLCSVVEAAATSSVDQVSEAVVAAIRAWQTQQLDDITLLIARYHE